MSDKNRVLILCTGKFRHIEITWAALDDAEKAMRLFSEKFSLPVAWAFHAYPTYSSGGVVLGNVNIELSRDNDSPRTGFAGMGLEPGGPAPRSWLLWTLGA